MAPIDDFKQFITDAEAGQQFAKWVHDNPGEMGRWQAFRDLVLKYETTGIIPPTPTMTTPHGRELIDAAKLYLDAVYGKTPPPLPPDPIVPPPVVPPVVTPPPATTLWNGDFSITKDFSQWGQGQNFDTKGQTVASVGSHTVCELLSPPPAGFPANLTHVARCTTYGDSTGQGGSPARARAQYGTKNLIGAGAKEGAAFGYEWWMMWPSDLNDDWAAHPYFEQYFEFNTNSGYNGPSMGIGIPGKGQPQSLLVQVSTLGGRAAPHLDVQVALPLPVLDQVYHCDMQIGWSADKANGWFQLLQDDKVVIPKQPAQTMPNDGGNQFWTQGTYRTQANGGRNRSCIYGGARRYALS